MVAKTLCQCVQAMLSIFQQALSIGTEQQPTVGSHILLLKYRAKTAQTNG